MSNAPPTKPTGLSGTSVRMLSTEKVVSSSRAHSGLTVPVLSALDGVNVHSWSQVPRYKWRTAWPPKCPTRILPSISDGSNDVSM